MSLTIVEPSAQQPTQNILIYGPSGTGKTVAACSAPGPILVLNAEGPGALRKAREIHSGTEIREATITAKAVLDEAFLYLREGNGIATVVVDTLGEMYRILLEEQGGEMPQIQHYGTVNTVVERFVRALRDLPVNVVLVAHEELVTDGTTGETIRQPVTGGKKLPAQVMAQMDVVGYAGVRIPEGGGEPEYLAQVVSGGGRNGKDRSGRLGTVRRMDLSEWIQTAAGTSAPADDRKGA